MKTTIKNNRRAGAGVALLLAAAFVAAPSAAQAHRHIHRHHGHVRHFHHWRHHVRHALYARAASQPHDGDFARQELAYINAFREQSGLAPLTPSPRLDALARHHTALMRASNTLGHMGFMERYQQSGYLHCVENAGWNYTSPRQLFDGWYNSPHHRENMENPDIRYAGVAVRGAWSSFFACN